MGEITIRPARESDLETLNRITAETKNSEPQDYRRTVPFVAEIDGEVVGFIAARMVWQIEPLYLDPAWKRRVQRYAPHLVRRVVYLLAKKIDDWLSDRGNNPYVRSYFAHSLNRGFEKLMMHWGMHRLYMRGRFYGKDLP